MKELERLAIPFPDVFAGGCSLSGELAELRLLFIKLQAKFGKFVVLRRELKGDEDDSKPLLNGAMVKACPHPAFFRLAQLMGQDQGDSLYKAARSETLTAWDNIQLRRSCGRVNVYSTG